LYQRVSLAIGKKKMTWSRNLKFVFTANFQACFLLFSGSTLDAKNKKITKKNFYLFIYKIKARLAQDCCTSNMNS